MSFIGFLLFINKLSSPYLPTKKKIAVLKSESLQFYKIHFNLKYKNEKVLNHEKLFTIRLITEFSM